MQQRFLFRRPGEVVRVSPEVDIGHKDDRGQEAPGKADEISRQQHDDGYEAGGNEHGDQRRHDAADAALVELADAETIRPQLVPDDRCDQEARQDEKDVDAEVSTRQSFRREVVSDDGGYCDRPEPVDITPIGSLGHEALPDKNE